MSTYQTKGLVVRGRYLNDKRYRVAIEVVIDLPRLDRELADRALHNRSGKTQLLSGIIKARLLSRELDV
jgi:hypothetical protein